jgi:hypothetical protein
VECEEEEGVGTELQRGGDVPESYLHNYYFQAESREFFGSLARR